MNKWGGRVWDKKKMKSKSVDRAEWRLSERLKKVQPESNAAATKLNRRADNGGADDGNSRVLAGT